MRSLMCRVALTGVATASLTGVAVGATTVDAAAHTGNLPVTAVCNTATGQYDFTAKLSLSNTSGKVGTSRWKIGTSSFEGTPTSFNGLNRGPISTNGDTTVTLVGTKDGEVKFSLPGSTKGLGPWFYAYTTWSGASKGSDGQLKQTLKGDCKQAIIKDASAGITVTPATCDANGTASVTKLNYATLVGTLDQSVGSHVATFKSTPPPHRFSNGSDTYQESYVVPGKLTGASCTTPPPPSYNCPPGTTGVDTDGDGVIEKDECQKLPPPAVIMPKAKVRAYCVTPNWGEGIARVINKQSNRAVSMRIVRSGKDRVVRVKAGKTKIVELRHLRVGSIVKVKIGKKIFASTKVKDGCGTPDNPHTGHREAAAAG